MQTETGWNPEHLATQGTRGLPDTYDDEPSSIGTILLNKLNPFKKKLDKKTIQSIKIICDTLRHIISNNKYTNTIEDAFNNYNNNTTRQYKLPYEIYEESMKRLINISKFKKYIESVYFREDYDKSIDKTPQESLEKLIKTLRYIILNYEDYIKQKYEEIYKVKYNEDYKSSLPSLKQQIYKELIEHLKNIKYSSLTINKRDETLEQSGGNNKQYKEILGKRRRIYKIKGSRKEHVKYKGELIPVSDYKKLVKK